MNILDLHREGLSVSAIAERLGLDRKTVRKYINGGVQIPQYGPRQQRARVVDSFIDYVTTRIREYPQLSIERLLREIRAMGYTGARTAQGDLVREVRPPRTKQFEVHFETPAGLQAQVDFSHFTVEFGPPPRGVGDQSGYLHWCWATVAISGDVSSSIRIYRRSCAATWKCSNTSAVRLRKFCTIA